MRASSLSYNTIAINREIDSRYDVIKEVSEHLDEIAEIATQLEDRDTANRNTDNHVDGTVNGVYTLAERTKLSTIEVNAKDDQTAEEIEVLYEGLGNTNKYTDAEKLKLAGLNLVDNTADSAKNVLSATKLTTARTINGVSFDGTADITTYDSTKVAKVASTDNNIVRFNGTGGEVKDSLVIIDDLGNLTGTRLICAGAGNDYNTGAIEVNGNGSTVFPNIGFHQSGVYAGTLQQTSGNEFSFFNQVGAYATLKNNINMQNAINVNGTVGGSVLTSNVIVESGSNANGAYTKFANGSMMEYKSISCAATANVRYYETITWPISGAVSGTSCCVYVVDNTLEYVFSQPPAFNGPNFYFVADTSQSYYFVLTRYTP